MNEEFIKSSFQVATYTLKEGTKGSYYWTEGFSELPNRLSISRDNELTKVSRKGRNLLHPIVGQMIGSFTQKEVSRYKEANDRQLHPKGSFKIQGIQTLCLPYPNMESRRIPFVYWLWNTRNKQSGRESGRYWRLAYFLYT